MVRVIFTYDETIKRWDVLVKGAKTAVEARQSFNAVVLTCQQLDPRLLNHSLVTATDEGFGITPAV